MHVCVNIHIYIYIWGCVCMHVHVLEIWGQSAVFPSYMIFCPIEHCVGHRSGFQCRFIYTLSTPWACENAKALLAPSEKCLSLLTLLRTC